MAKAVVGVAALVMLLVSAGAAWAQGRLIPPALTRLETGSCARCTLRLESVVTIGTADDKELVPENGMPATPRAGQFFVGDIMGKQPILQYDSLGRFIGTIGRLGDGPGEYRGAQAIAAARGDSIAIYKYPRVAIISTETGRGRSVRHATGIQGFRILSTPNGSTLIQNYTERNPSFVVVAPTGETTRAFGPASKVDLGGGHAMNDPEAQQFVLARSPSGGFWAVAMHYHHLLEHWTFDGRLVRRIERLAPWFPIHDEMALSEHRRMGAGLVAPLPIMLGAWADGRGHLFVVGRVADAKWQEDPAAKAPPAGRVGSVLPNEALTGGIDRYFDGVIEVYDEATGGLLGSWRSDVFPGAFTETGLLVDSRQSEEGVKSFVFWRLRFDRH